jgi:hypothetical protein
VYDIKEGNTSSVLKSLWPSMKKKGNVAKIHKDWGVLILFAS